MRVCIGKMEGYARTPRIRYRISRRDEFPWRAIRIRNAPFRRGAGTSASFALRHNPFREKKREFGSHPGKTDALAPHFIRCGDVVVLLERGALHPRTVINTAH